jgi:hypothetical protein
MGHRSGANDSVQRHVLRSLSGVSLQMVRLPRGLFAVDVEMPSANVME